MQRRPADGKKTQDVAESGLDSQEMRVESVKEEASGAVAITAGGFSFFVDQGQLEALGLPLSALRPGAGLDEAAASILRLAAEAREAEKRGLSLLARAEQSALMLRQKLELRGFSGRAVALALERLAGQGWLDDARFARAYAASRLARRAEGPASLAAALRAKGVDADRAQAAVDGLLGPEARRAALAKAWSKELARSGGEPDKARSRLRALGFSSSELRAYLEEQEE